MRRAERRRGGGEQQINIPEDYIGRWPCPESSQYGVLGWVPLPFLVGQKAAGEHRNEARARSKQPDRRQPGQSEEVRPPHNRMETETRAHSDNGLTEQRHGVARKRWSRKQRGRPILFSCLCASGVHERSNVIRKTCNTIQMHSMTYKMNPTTTKYRTKLKSSEKGALRLLNESLNLDGILLSVRLNTSADIHR